MATFDTKFSLGDTVYIPDSLSLDITEAVVADIYVHASTLGNVLIEYRCIFSSDFTGKTKYKESEVYYKEEAKAIILQKLSERSAEIESLS